MSEIQKNYLPKYTCVRPGALRNNTVGIVIHWTANPGQSALGVRKYFAEDCVKTNTSTSAHYVIDANNIIEMIPHNEVAWHCGTSNYWEYTPYAKLLINNYRVGSPNYLMIGIECCVNDNIGKFNQGTIDNLKYLIAELKKVYSISDNYGILRHYDLTEKLCPKYYSTPKSVEWKNLLEYIKS